VNICFILATNEIDVHWHKPLSFGYLKAYLLRNANIPIAMDMVSSKEEALNYDIVAISATSQDYHNAVELARYIKSHAPDIIVVLGGHHITYLPGTMTRDFDIGVVGEGEQTFLELVECLHSNGNVVKPELMHDIKGIIFWNNESLKLTDQRMLLADMDRIPHPYRDPQDAPYLFTSRGCPYKCSFCSSTAFWNKTRFFSAEYVVEEINLLLEQNSGINQISIWDDLFIANKPRLDKIIGLIEQGAFHKQVSFCFSCRANLITDELCNCLKRLHLTGTSFGAESGSDRILKLMNKGTTVEQNQKSLDLLQKYGISAGCSFIVGWPTETEADIRKTYDFILKNVSEQKLTGGFSVNILMPIPGTPVWDDAVSAGLIDLKNFDWKRLSIFAAFRDSNIGTLQEWIDCRRENNSVYLAEDTLPQEQLYKLMTEYQCKLDILNRIDVTAPELPEAFAPADRIVSVQDKRDAHSTLEELPGYYRHVRSEILSAVPADALRILDVGCGAGLLGKALKNQNSGRLVIGIELNREAYSFARQNLDAAYNVDLENFVPPFATGQFDCIIFADVLEHLTNPWSVAKQYATFLKPGGTMITSIPNIRRLTILRELAEKGLWQYQDEGILDRTHLRFFTRRQFSELLMGASIVPHSLAYLGGDELASLKPDSNGNLRFGNLALFNVSPDEFAELCATQILFVGTYQPSSGQMTSATKDEQHSFMASIIIPVFNKVEYTQQCIRSIIQNTPADMFEIIIIDNASTDRTRHYLQGLSGDVRIIENSENVGYTIACNQGAAAARGKYLVFLNNDTEPKKGWLESLVRTAEQDLRVGAVGSKLIYPDGTLQEAGAVIFNDGSNGSIGKNGDPNDPKYNTPYEVDYCTGASLLVRHDLFKAVGGFDERYAPAYYEDPDLCFAIHNMGYRIVYCPQSEVIHHESVTAGHDLIDGIKKYYFINRIKFAEKWSTVLSKQPMPPVQPDPRVQPELPGREGKACPENNCQIEQTVTAFSGLSNELQEPPRELPVTVIDGVFFQLNNTGIARLWKALLSEWAGTEFGKSIVVLDRVGTAPRIPGIRYRIIPAYDFAPQGWDRNMLQQVCADEGADLFISTYYTTPLTTPSVFLAYDMIPEFTNFDLSQPQWQEKHHAISQASAFLAISGSTATDLAKLYPGLAERIVVAHCGLDREFFSPASTGEIRQLKERYGIAKPYFVFVGERNMYKNGRLLLEAFTRLPDKESYLLLYVGGQPVLEPDLKALAGNADVRVLNLSDEELKTAYSGAVALVYPSRYEGFGLPILEAMGCGCPVIACQTSSIPEVAGAAALYVDPDDPDQMATAMQQVQIPEVRQQLIIMGFRQANKFSWKKMADIIQNVIRGRFAQIDRYGDREQR